MTARRCKKRYLFLVLSLLLGYAFFKQALPNSDDDVEGDGEATGSAGAHPHRGTLPAFKLGPIPNFQGFSEAEARALEEGQLVLRQQEDTTRGKGLAVRDMECSPDDVMQELVDFGTYNKKVSMCSKSTVYGKNKLSGGKEQIKVDMSSTILPGFSFNCYFDHTIDMKGHSMIWSLDYDRKSDVDDIQGMWYVEKHPTKEGWCRVFYQIDMSLGYKIPAMVYRALAKSSLSNAVSWVKSYSEQRAKRRR
eukprot:TRINITY_DN98423_c0_g1_i1.p1 TRINITY_DN98423_c0_g1~~TRINITY_DN98423_c0_g1_i1.p1  ORF type:complete len:249 (+),score=52.55 TRINITY_DN98423_c0_g1_i1:59-805(+)